MNNKRHLHWSVILEESMGILAGILIIFLYNIDNVAKILSSNDENVQAAFNKIGTDRIPSWGIGLILVAFLCMVMMVNYVRWRNTYISLSQESIIFEKGKIYNKKSTVKLDTIASIQMKKTIFQRLMGTSQLKFDLNTNDSEVSRIKIILKDQDAQLFRKNALKKCSDSEPNDIQGKSLIDFGIQDVFRHCLLELNIVVVLGSIAFYSFMLTMSHLNTGTVLSIVIFTLGVVVPFLYRSIKSLFDLGNFKIYRKEKTIILSYGTFTHSVYEIPIYRINAVEIKQSFQARFFKRYCIEVVNAGLGDDENEKKILSLYINQGNLDCLMKELLPEFSYDKKETHQNLESILIHIIPLIFMVAVFIAVSVLISYWLLLGIIVFGFCFALNMRGKTFQTKKNQVLIGHGVFTKISTIILVARIQKIETKRTWISRKFCMTSMQVSVIGAKLDTGYFSQEMMDKFADHVSRDCK